MKIQEVIDYLNATFKPAYQESYDNSGFLVGDASQEITGALVALDLTPEVIDDAVEKGCNLICTHHPFMFGGVKRITPANEEGRMIIKLIENHICHYAAHTNLDNLRNGVSGILAEKLELGHCRVLRPMEDQLRKLVTYCPTADAPKVRQALWAAGGGNIGGYDCCSYNSEGKGTFRAGTDTHPYCGKVGELHEEAEVRIETIYEKRMERKLVHKLLEVHPYEEPAYDLIPLANAYDQVGGGIIGKLAAPMPTEAFLEKVKQTLGIPCIRTSALCRGSVETVALCGGSGNFMIGDAKAQGADIYLTGDLKYHDFQQAEGEIVLAEIGHYESEQFAKQLIYSAISKKFTTFACSISEKSRGYIYYI